MSSYRYERLSDQDNDFLLWESPTLPMHVGGLTILEVGRLRNEHGGVDFERIKRLTESLLHLIPRYRQKLAWIPGAQHAVWVDDELFNLDYHFRHTSLPRPGSDEQLKRLTARLMEHSLDRSRPLWEAWVVEGLDGDRFAVVHKIHHCMIDGASGVNLSQLLFSRTPDREIRPPARFIPRRMPSPQELASDEWRRRLTTPLWLGRKLVDFARETPDLPAELERRARSLIELGRRKVFPVSETPINGVVGPHRIVEWTELSFADVRAVKKALGGSVNDLVLTIVTGAVRKLMLSRQVDPARLEFRASTPVNVRRERDDAVSGNRVSSWMVRLPIGLEDPLEQLRAIHEETVHLKDSDEAGVVKMMMTLMDLLGLDVQSLSTGAVNTVVSNVPGPADPLYLLGAEALQMIPLPPLLANVGLTIGAMTYNGRLGFGLHADPGMLPDLAEFRIAIERAFARLAAAAGVQAQRPVRPEPVRDPPPPADLALPPATAETRNPSQAH